MRTLLLPLALFALVACRDQAPADASGAPPAADASTPAAPAPAPPAEPASPTGDNGATSGQAGVLAGKTWRVERRSDGGEIGATYAFLADGTLVVDSPNGTPMTGRWAVDAGGALSLTEEGVTYPTDLEVRDADRITLRSHHPGGVVEIALVRAPDATLPVGR